MRRNFSLVTGLTAWLIALVVTLLSPQLTLTLTEAFFITVLTVLAAFSSRELFQLVLAVNYSPSLFSPSRMHRAGGAGGLAVFGVILIIIATAFPLGQGPSSLISVNMFLGFIGFLLLVPAFLGATGAKK